MIQRFLKVGIEDDAPFCCVIHYPLYFCVLREVIIVHRLVTKAREPLALETCSCYAKLILIRS